MELRPCPFCGNKAYLRSFSGSLFKKTKAFYVECFTCRVRTSMEIDAEYAVKVWNRRADNAVD